MLLIAWNRQAAKDRLRANLDYQFNLKTEMGFAQINESLERVSGQVQSLVSGSQADEAAREVASAPGGLIHS